MKKWFIILTVLSVQASAQKISMSIKAGLLVNDQLDQWVSGSHVQRTNNWVTLDFLVGAQTKLSLSDEFSFSTELQLAKKGTSYFVELNPLVHYSPAKRFEISTGPSVGFLAYSPTHYSLFFDLGANAGVAYSLNDKLSLGLRFSHGIFPSRYIENYYGEPDPNDPVIPGSVDMRGYNRNVQISLGYTLRKRDL